MKIHLKPKHWELGRHYARFVDRRWFPEFRLTESSLEVFIRVESHGRSSCTAEELHTAEPLFNGKQMHDLTLKLLYDEMAEWWSRGDGWYYPIAESIRRAMWPLQHEEHHGEPRDRIWIRALISVMRACHNRETGGFLGALLRYPGMPQADKSRYIAIWNSNNADKKAA